jgi:hypothetical protein
MSSLYSDNWYIESIDGRRSSQSTNDCGCWGRPQTDEERAILEEHEEQIRNRRKWYHDDTGRFLNCGIVVAIVVIIWSILTVAVYVLKSQNIM